ncbi:MAG: altronate dehydratase family protein [Alphaproteobacteria bacterium]|jgi:altronate hydrolase|nr:altronate dehydratase family protein [Alphaproteobacteria bacterium]
MLKFLKINPKDNVVVALQALTKDEVITVDGVNITINTDIPMGHKVAITAIAAGENVIKYGNPIGHAKENILVGDWIHTHNMATNLAGILNYTYSPTTAVSKGQANLPKATGSTFMGYKRHNGQVGIRNEVWIIPTVGCVSGIAKLIAEESKQFQTPAIENIYSFTHPHGCSQVGGDHLSTQKFLAGLINHPNAGSVLVLGLGCENNQIEDLKKVIGEYDPNRVKFLVSQEVENEIEAGVALMKELCQYAAVFKREPCSASNLIIGLKCGGSDGFSGITANPLVGAISNRVIAEGGVALLTEVPEMFGAETILMNRCRNEAVFKRVVNLINNFKEYFMSYGEKIDENPSPGNKAGGISTLEEKSLGCTQKAGDALVEDVLPYGERVGAKQKGLLLVQSPGNDLIATNALNAAGAQLVLFTTGRGTPFSAPAPTVKISSNSNLANFKKTWIDFDAGVLLEEADLDKLADEFWTYILEVASGTVRAKSESLDKSELAIFKDGITL